MHRSYIAAKLEGCESVAGVAFYQIQKDVKSGEVQKSVPWIAFCERESLGTPPRRRGIHSIGPLKSARTPTARCLGKYIPIYQ